MKTYVEVELKAKNAPSGSYAAGCPDYHDAMRGGDTASCRRCERAM